MARRKTEGIDERIVFIPDVHVPYHCKRAWSLCLAAIKKFKPSIVVVLGDFADFLAVSFHPKGPDKETNLLSEVVAVRKCLRELKKAAGKARIVYCEGNHEYRLSRYINEKCPELFGITSVPEVLEVAKLGIEWFPYKTAFTMGNLLVTHDTGRAGMNAHKQAIADVGGAHSVVIGHVHRIAVHHQRTLTGKIIQGASFGWLGDPNSVGYMHRAKVQTQWAHGLGLGYMSKQTVSLVPVPFHGRRCFIEGKVVEV